MGRNPPRSPRETGPTAASLRSSEYVVVCLESCWADGFLFAAKNSAADVVTFHDFELSPRVLLDFSFPSKPASSEYGRIMPPHMSSMTKVAPFQLSRDVTCTQLAI